MKDFFRDEEGRIRCTIGNYSKITHYNYENVSKSNDLGNFAKKKKKYQKNINPNIYKHDIDKNFNRIGSKLYSTQCPVCRSNVYFCLCSNGGKVFFDSLSPEWNKHPCTNKQDFREKENSIANIFIYPTSLYHNNLIFDDSISCLGKFQIPSKKNKIFIKNIIKNVTILVGCKNGYKYLTIIISNKKYKNRILFKDKKFSSLLELTSFIFFILKQQDFSKYHTVNIIETNYPLFKQKDIFTTKTSKQKKSNLKHIDKSKLTIKKASTNIEN